MRRLFLNSWNNPGWYFLLIVMFLLVFAFSLSFIQILSSQYPFLQSKRIAFIAHTETMGGKGVYELYQEMKRVGHDTKIIAIPSFYQGKFLADIDLTYMEKFDRKDVIYPCGKKSPYTKCKNVEDYKFDYIFVANPYDSFKNSILDPYYLIPSLKKISKKLMFIVYGPHLFHQDFINDPNLPNVIDTVFVDSESTKKIYIEKYKFPSERVIVSGYQPYREVRQGLKKTTLSHEKKLTILWLPRWYLSFANKDKFEGGSTFLNYHYFFYNYAKNNPQINFIIRPHLLLYSQSVEWNFLSQEDLNNIFQRFRSLKNMTISDHKNISLINDVLASDIVISDGTSALGEVVVANKPIIYLSNGWNNEFNSNELSKEFKNHLFFAYGPPDIVRLIDYIKDNRYQVFSELDSPLKKNPNMGIKVYLKTSLKYLKCKLSSKTCNREKFKKILDPVENPAQFIAKYLLRES